MDLAVSHPAVGNNSIIMVREYRKGNWTLEETMVLIEAKKMDDQRRMKQRLLGDSSERGKPAELRWKWVEDYCWKHGCLRSQNQCNDKWDNLMRDFKKVREYEKRVADDSNKSYWRIDKNERKHNNLPSNLLLQIYEALLEVVVDRKGQWSSPPPPVVSSGGAGTSNVGLKERPCPSNALAGHHQPPPPPLSIPMLQPYPITTTHQPATIVPPAVPVPPPPPAPAGGAGVAEPSSAPASSQPSPVVDSESSGEYYYTESGSAAKRRKRGGGGGEGGGKWMMMMREVGRAIWKSGRMIAEAIEACEEREERRHREVVTVHQTRLALEESKAEMNRQGLNALADAINKLANSILLALPNNNHHHHNNDINKNKSSTSSPPQ